MSPIRRGTTEPQLYKEPKFPPPSPRASTVALILGGGESDRRLFPLTQKRALPAVPVGGSYRLIDIPMTNCLHGTINKIYVLTQYNSQSLNRYITRAYGLGDGVPIGGDGFIEVLATTQYPGGARWSEGNADAVRLMSWVLENPKLRNIENVLILPADQLYRADFENLLIYHREQRAAVTIVTHPAQEHQVADLGVLQVDPATCEMVDYCEKPRNAREREALRLSPEHSKALADGAPFLASCGIYVFNKQFLLKLLREHPRAHNFGADVLPLVPEAAKEYRRAAEEQEAALREAAAARGKERDSTAAAAAEEKAVRLIPYRVMTWRLHGYWADVGASLRTFMAANLDCLRGATPFDQFEHHDLVLTGALALPPTDMRGCHISRSSISPGGRISGATISGSVIGPRAIIGPGVEIRDSVIMGADYFEEDLRADATVASKFSNGSSTGSENEGGELPIPPMGIGAGSLVHGALIDKNARIGRNCVIANRAGVWEAMDRVGVGLCVREGVPIVTKSAVLYDGTEL
ncbi:hypothetical protein GPECTOR_83g292 [Gonium pectorale]|uniref:glucose-1-phosphate adenylyltransferase n=1 Tax=Gonium pectorale TaxID=33097 RepID=A0A150G2Y9_GONPE|nr:hypothetical protein GPECTOR_83g292 [Gonium pectorale]|eukprot:KXZ43680.1 hypothetical protein GPECTOR_83g292 [Gonium pectorale]